MNLDLFDSKTAQRFRDLAAEVQLARETGANHGVVLADAVQAMKRLNKRARVAPGFERVEIVQHKGPTIDFTGQMLASDKFITRGDDPMRIEMEIWETQGGALVAVRSSEPAEREGVEIVWATVIEPEFIPTYVGEGLNLTCTGAEVSNALAMHCAVMDAFDWQDRARSMARKLGWSLRVEVS